MISLHAKNYSNEAMAFPICFIVASLCMFIYSICYTICISYYYYIISSVIYFFNDHIMFLKDVFYGKITHSSLNVENGNEMNRF